MKVRNLKAEDLAVCAQIYVRAFSSHPYYEQWDEKTAYRRLTEFYEGNPSNCYCAEIEDRIVAMLFAETHTWRDGISVYVLEVAVDPDYQGKGIGRSLLSTCADIFRGKNYRRMEVLVNRYGPVSDFYQKLGFRETNYYLMVKELQ